MGACDVSTSQPAPSPAPLELSWRLPCTSSANTSCPAYRVLSTVPADSRTTADPGHESFVSSTVYGSSAAGQGIPRFEMPEEEMPARNALRFV